jgi:hypothetical protein
LIIFNSWPWERTARGGSGAGVGTAVGLGLGTRVVMGVVGLLLEAGVGEEGEGELRVAPVPQAARRTARGRVAINP